jgi:hypothetical protein
MVERHSIRDLADIWMVVGEYRQIRYGFGSGPGIELGGWI